MPFPGFLSQSDNLQFTFIKNIKIINKIIYFFLILKILTDYHKTMKTDMDLHLEMTY